MSIVNGSARPGGNPRPAEPTPSDGDHTEPGPDPVDGDVLDVLGIGFGPSNLALAIAVTEHNAEAAPGEQLSAAFVEQQEAFGWHRGMLIEGATMQVSFLKDLVTMRNPTSASSFLAYLAARGRLADFINNKSLYPSRVEFHDYLEWAESGVRDLVTYGTRAVSVRPVRDGDASPGGPVTELDVTLVDVASGVRTVRRTRNLVLATGLSPMLPDDRTPSARVWHTSELLFRLADLPTSGDRAPRRFVVVGAGQSAAETAAHLHGRFPEAEVDAVFSRYGYSPADDTSFANRIFDPDAVDDFFVAPSEVKEMLLDYHSNTNYSVVDPELISELYRRSYQEKVAGVERLHVRSACRVGGVRERADDVEVQVDFLPTGESRTLRADVVVYATGYRSIDPHELLGEVGSWCAHTADGELLVDRDYRVSATGPLGAGVYLQGPTEHTHGISSTLLSTTAIRAGEIVESIRRGPSAVLADAGAPLAARAVRS